MQIVSESYNAYPNERWSNIRVVFELVDVDAAEDATATATSEAEISQLSQTHNRINEISKKLATLEQDYFLLDGTYVLPDETDNTEVGWWSNEISNINGVLETPQVLEFNFTENQSSVGFMVIFDTKANEYASDFKIEIFDAQNTLLGEDSVIGNTKHTYISEMPVENYRKVRITFTKTSKPYRRVRVCEVVFGIIQTFDDANTTNLKLLYEISPSMENLPSNELTITIENTDRKYNMINPKGIYKYLQQGQGLNVELGVGQIKETVERVNMGRFYFTAATAEDSSMTAQIVAHDWFYALDSSTCRIGANGTWTVSEAVTAVITDSGLPITASIPSTISSRIINKCIPRETSHREALRLIAQASMSVCHFSRNNELVFMELIEAEPVDTLDNSNLYNPAKVMVSDRINKIEIAVRDEYAQTEVIYTATNKDSGETDKVKAISNPLAASQTVAEWFLTVLQRRIYYDLQERGNPAREITDIVKIYDAYFENRNAIITKQEYLFDGTLRANSEAWGGGI